MLDVIAHLNRFIDDIRLIDFEAFQVSRLCGIDNFNGSDFLHVFQTYWQQDRPRIARAHWSDAYQLSNIPFAVARQIADVYRVLLRRNTRLLLRYRVCKTRRVVSSFLSHTSLFVKIHCHVNFLADEIKIKYKIKTNGRN